MNGSEVHKLLISTIDLITQRFPNVKIVVSEITPRLDQYDAEVIKCNSMLANSILIMKNVILIDHSNLRGGEHHNDNKHIKRESIRYFAGNIKAALRLAFNKETRIRNFEFENSNDKITRNSNVIEKPISQVNPKSGAIYQIIDLLKGLL